MPSANHRIIFHFYFISIYDVHGCLYEVSHDFSIYYNDESIIISANYSPHGFGIDVQKLINRVNAKFLKGKQVPNNAFIENILQNNSKGCGLF